MASNNLEKQRQTTENAFENAKSMFPARFRENGWYLTVLAALIASGKPEMVGDLYSYLITQPEYATPSQRHYLVRWMRGALVRCCLINGVPLAMEATASIAAVEREEDKDYGFVRENWKLDEENRSQGTKRVELVLGGDFEKFVDKFAAHKDILYMIIDVGYGLGLSQDQELDMIETELVILPAVMCQNLVAPTHFHLRGSLNVGIEKEEVELIHQTIEYISVFVGKKLEPVGRVADALAEMFNLIPKNAK